MEMQHMDYNQRTVKFQLTVSFDYADKVDCRGYNLCYKVYGLGIRNTVFITPNLKYFCNIF